MKKMILLIATLMAIIFTGCEQATETNSTDMNVTEVNITDLNTTEDINEIK